MSSPRVTRPRAFWRRNRPPSADPGGGTSRDEAFRTINPTVRSTSTPATLFSITIGDLAGFFSAPPFRRTVTSSLVFLHNKRPSADLLVELATTIQPNVRFELVRASQCDLIDLASSLSAQRASRAERRRVLVLEADVPGAEIERFLLAIGSIRHLKKGLWLRGYVSDLRPAVLRMFDVMFMFDMAAAESEQVRSTIPLPRDRMDELKESMTSSAEPERVMVFTAATDRHGKRLTQVGGNPAVLSFRRSPQEPSYGYPR